MSRYYDRAGNPISASEWSLENNRVAHTKMQDAEVSTVYLGLDHSYDDGPPLIFETMIFGGPREEQMWRYTTEAQAKAGHEHAVQLVRSDENSRGSDAAVAAHKGDDY